jgi:hypothetical protein
MDSFTRKKRVVKNWMTDFVDHIRAMSKHLLDPDHHGQLLFGLNAKPKEQRERLFSEWYDYSLKKDVGF